MENTNGINLPETELTRFDVIFEPVEPTPINETMSQRDKIIKINKDAGIRVQSVSFPSNHNFFVEKKETEILDWLQNKIHSQYSALYQINKKYTDDDEQVQWNNNNMQNQRYLETNGGISTN
jgi:hypothetical protein